MRDGLMRSSPLAALAAALGVSLWTVAAAHAQAWLPPKGEATFTLGLARSFADQHTDDDGNNLTLPTGDGWGSMTWNDVDPVLGYGITDRLAVRVSLPFVIAKYEGGAPHPPLPGHQNLDDGSWHSAFGDFSAQVRFKATQGSLVVTPLLAFGVPSHSYEYYAHATAGLHLSAGQVGVILGRLLDPWLDNAYVQARYTFTMPATVLGIRHDSSNVTFDVGYFVTSALTLNVFGEWQKTHGGWRFIDVPPPNPPTDPNFLYHDQLLRADHFQLGGSASYAVTRSIELGLSGYATLHSARDMNVAGIALSMTYGFSPAQVIKRSRHPKSTPAGPTS
jgi:hypothetical protein